MTRATRVQSAPWSTVIASGIITAVMLSGCGENPAFTEQAATPAKAGELGKDASTNTGNNGFGDSVAGGGNGSGSSSASENGGSNTSNNGGYTVDGVFQPNNVDPGTETAGNLLLVHDSSTLQTISKVDILWVVDSSGSMAEEQSYLGTNFRSFIGGLASSNSDFQLGVTTTDICSSQNPSQVPMNERWCPTLDGSSSGHYRGTLVGDTNKKVLKPTTSDLNARFTRYANVGTNGSGFEHGLKATEMAISKSMAGQNEGLVRSDAFLAVIVVSDEEDDGIGLGITDSYTGINYVTQGLTSARYTDSDLIRYLGTNKGAGMFSVSAITGTRLANGSLCTSPHSQPQEAGTQYIAAANKTGGIVQSICDTNWSASLANIGRDINAQSSQIVLSKPPYSGTIRVYVNGVENFQWTYNSGNNSIKFNSGQVPASGSAIDVAYWNAP
jgi:hypothetical protein